MSPKKDEYMRGYGDGFKEGRACAATDTVAQRIEQAEPDEGRKDAGSTPAGAPPHVLSLR